MMKLKNFAFILILFIYGCSSGFVLINENKIHVSIADNPQERSIGLMYEKNLCENCGMLFVFENEGVHKFWMKNTLIPLDIIFISNENKIVDIIEAELCKEDPCQTYAPKDNAKYVLEINKGYSNSKRINIGDEVKMHL